MRLGIDAREIQDGISTEMGQALYNFLFYYDRILSKDRCILFSSKPLPFQFSEKIRNYVLGEAFSFWWEQVQLPAAAKEAQVEVLCSLHARVPLQGRAKKVAVIPSLIDYEFAPYRHEMPLMAFLYDRFFLKRLVNAADKVMTVSLFSRDAVSRVYGVDRRKIEVVPLGISSVFRPDPEMEALENFKLRQGIPERYVLSSGSFAPHENVLSLVQAFGILAGRYPDLNLVLVGPQDVDADALKEAVVQAGLQKKVFFVDRPGNAEAMRLFYAGAEVFVAPSLYETFGLSALEAMACGTMVVASHAGCFPETMDGAALLVDTARPQALADGIERAMKDKILQASLRARGFRRTEALSEGNTAKRMFDFFYDIAGY